MSKSSPSNHHGKKTNRAIIKSLRKRHENHIDTDSIGHLKSHRGAGHRLFEDRQQHDESEKKSEKTRLSKDNLRHHHDPDNFGLPRSGNK